MRQAVVEALFGCEHCLPAAAVHSQLQLALAQGQQVVLVVERGVLRYLPRGAGVTAALLGGGGRLVKRLLL